MDYFREIDQEFNTELMFELTSLKSQLEAVKDKLIRRDNIVKYIITKFIECSNAVDLNASFTEILQSPIDTYIDKNNVYDFIKDIYVKYSIWEDIDDEIPDDGEQAVWPILKEFIIVICNIVETLNVLKKDQ